MSPARPAPLPEMWDLRSIRGSRIGPPWTELRQNLSARVRPAPASARQTEHPVAKQQRQSVAAQAEHPNQCQKEKATVTVLSE